MRNYRKHLHQPYYIQKIQDYSLPFPIRLNKVITYLVFIFILYVPFKFIVDIENFIVSTTTTFVINIFFLPMIFINIIDKLEMDGKNLGNYLFDILKFYFIKFMKKDIFYRFENVKECENISWKSYLNKKKI